MKITVWGARGSLPSPLKPKEIEEKIFQTIFGLPDYLDTNDRDEVWEYINELPPLLRGTAGGNTSCVEIQTGGSTFIIDAGSGIRELGLELVKGPCGRGEGVLHIFFSHAHWDHIQGFPFFVPAFIPGNRIFIYSIHPLEKAISEQQRPLNFPVSLSYMQADIQFINIQEGQPFTVRGVKVNTIRNAHPGIAYSFRFEDQYSSFVYANDAEYQKLDEANIRPYLAFFKDADALIFDAQYTLTDVWQVKEDWGHSSAMIGVDLARMAGVKRLILFHHDPSNTDAQLLKIQQRAIAYQLQDTTLPSCEVIAAYEGLKLDLSSSDALDLRFALDKEAAVLTPTRSFDQRSLDQLAHQLARISEQDASSTPIIDLSQVETLTTAGLKPLIALQRTQSASQLVLAKPSESVQKIIKLSGYSDFFAIYPSVEAALDAIRAREALNLPGQMIKGRYRIESKVGEGRLGTVLKATDTQLNRIVALKLLSPSFSPETIARFMHRARQIVALEHSNIVKAFDWDEDDGFPFKVEEFMEGQSLQGRLIENRSLLPDVQAMDIAVDIALALENAHSRGIIHGDLKPQNIFLTDEGAKLSGFSLGHLEEGRNLLDAPLLFLTASYLAPEQILGHPLDVQTDLYALGVLLYQLFTGRLPFEGDDQTVMQAHLHQHPQKPSDLNPGISILFEHLILKLLDKNLHDRYVNAQQVRRILCSLILGAQRQSSRHRERLVGRERELEVFQLRWQKAGEGQGQLLLVSGNMGIGKSSLARHAAAQAEAPIVLLGQGCNEERNRPFCLFTQILQSYLATIPDNGLGENARQLLSNLAQILPDFKELHSELTLPSLLLPPQEKERLMSSLVEFIKLATTAHPWLVILDDLHWADQSSLDLLVYLAKRLSSMPLLIIGVYTDIEEDRDLPLSKALGDLQVLPACRHYALKNLDQAEAQQALSNIWQYPAPAALSEKIYRHSAGNPFYIEQIVKGLADDGLIALRGGEWQFPATQELRLPESAREAVWRRIHHLNPDTQTLLRQAAVLGQAFHLDDLRAMSGLSDREILEHLDMVLERHFVRAIPDSLVFHFVHTEIHHVLYADIGPERRRELHRQAGQVLEDRAKPEPERYAETLAYHFDEAGDFQRALIYSLQAARRAERMYANKIAEEWYHQTLRLIEHLDPTGLSQFQPVRLSIHKSLGWILFQLGQFDEALAHLHHSIELANEQESPFEAALAQRILGQVYLSRGERERAESFLQQSLQVFTSLNELSEASKTEALLTPSKN